jgi:hypothetical protein
MRNAVTADTRHEPDGLIRAVILDACVDGLEGIDATDPEPLETLSLMALTTTDLIQNRLEARRVQLPPSA